MAGAREILLMADGTIGEIDAYNAVTILILELH